MNSEKSHKDSPITLRRIVSVMLCALICVLLLVSFAYPVLMDTVIINNYGSIANHEMTAASGSPGDIQAAVNLVNSAGGGTVYVPAGTFYFNDETVQIHGGVNVIGAGIGNTILQQNKTAPFNDMFYLDGNNIRISGIEFKGLVESSDSGLDGVGIQVWRGLDFRIDHCKFTDFPTAAIGVGNYYENLKQPKGVIDHCIIDNPYKDIYSSSIWAYGIIVSGHKSHWYSDITTYLGKYEMIPDDVAVAYIEDNTFSRCRHAIASNQAAWYVVRHCTFTNPRPVNYGQVDVHGNSGEDSAGGRGLECYENTIIGGSSSTSIGCLIRGGGGVIFSNVFQSNMVNIRILNDGQTVETYTVNDMWIWGNTGSGTMVENYGNTYVENVDYFLRAPNQAQDGFTYTSYPYPHPLTLETTP